VDTKGSENCWRRSTWWLWLQMQQAGQEFMGPRETRKPTKIRKVKWSYVEQPFVVNLPPGFFFFIYFRFKIYFKTI
jgi:hypothetical protein